ncbi:MAG: LCP family protein [Clostridiales bacterium]|nr:LCP family protein [Clostridiales bacterium]
MKRCLSLLMALALLLAAVPLMGLAQQEVPDIQALPPDQIPPTPTGMHHYLLVCMDSWAARMSRLGYSDGMVLVTVDEVAGRIIATSFIRDMLVLHPDEQPGRLTYIVKEYGMQGLLDTINRHFGLQIEKYILMDWSQVQSIVDAVGGVQLTVTDREAGYLKRYAISPKSTTPAMNGAGNYHFTGHAAVIYMRTRRVPALNGDPHDIGRTYRTRLVLSSIADSLRDISYEKARNILDSVMNNILSTNMTTADMLQAFNMVFALRGTPVEMFRLPVDGTFRSFDYFGGASQLMDFAPNREALHDFLFDHSFVVNDINE